MSELKPSEQIVRSPFDGKVITDSLGRNITLKSPSILDRFDMNDIVGARGENINNSTLIFALMHVASVNETIFFSPKDYAEFRGYLAKLGEEGVAAVIKFWGETQSKSDAGSIEEVKK